MRPRRTKPRGRTGLMGQLLIFVLALGIVGAMAIQPTRQLLAQRRLIGDMSNDLGVVERSNRDLKRRIARLHDPDFLEQRAREQIGLVRPNETSILVLPPSRAAVKRKAASRVVEPPPPPDPGFIGGLLGFLGLPS